MPETLELIDSIFNVNDDRMFERAALQVFRMQFDNCAVYRQYCELVGRNPSNVGRLEEIPFLPVEFFRDFAVSSYPITENTLLFRSSATTSSRRSSHYVADPGIYQRSLLQGFTKFWGPPGNYRILALLPGYLEQSESSLVYMMDALIKQSEDPDSGFYLNDYEALHRILTKPAPEGRSTMLLGVSHALLDFGERFPANYPDLGLVETGGMKGRREEIVREDLHRRLSNLFGVVQVGSEYGMTELLSQAWATSGGLFRSVPWMQVVIRDPNDPFALMPHGRSGGINIIDLANIHSCSFIATQDLGRMHPGGEFEVLGRFDHSDVRGCNLLIA